jgi:anti-sigma factor RsiW
VSHLNEQLSALIDGELSGTELDRVNAHLAACEPCRGEAAGLRVLKRELRGLAATRPSEELTRRLLTMAGPGGPVPQRQLNGTSRPRPAFRAYPDRPPGPRRGDFAAQASPTRPGPHSPSDAWARRGRGRHIAWGAVSFLVTMMIGAVALSLTVDSSNGRIPTQLELSTIAHAFMNGSVPMFEPAQPPPRLKPQWGPSGSPGTPAP